MKHKLASKLFRKLSSRLYYPDDESEPGAGNQLFYGDTSVAGNAIWYGATQNDAMMYGEP